MKKIAVIGSINTDFTFACKNLPSPSETIKGSTFKINYGGKGANVAVATSRLGAKISLFGILGDDIFSKENLKNLKKEKINTKIEIHKNTFGGVAGIMVDEKTNSIIVVPGSNELVDKKFIDENSEEMLKSDIFGLQLETPLNTNLYLIEKLHKNNKTIVFNPSPIHQIDAKYYDMVTYIIVNEKEITNLPNYASFEQIFDVYKEKLIMTKGKDGVFYYSNGKICQIPAIKNKVIDTTGAGDTFLASFMVGLSKDYSLEQSVKFANICAGLKISKLGAQTGMPTLEDVNKYIKKNKIII